MSAHCKHCASPYEPGSGVDGFCCPGCRQVYQLIREEGLESYYHWQDKATEPLKDRAVPALDEAALRRLQAEVEQGGRRVRATLRISGMSCLGCVWLVERLARKSKGVFEAEVSLSGNRLSLEWCADDFDLVALADELLRFGYRLDGTLVSDVSKLHLSPLALRCLLTGVFAVNGLFLALYERFVMPAGTGGTLVDLLSLACLLFSLMIGAAPFFITSFRSIQMRRWHSDWVPCLILLGSAIYALVSTLGLGASWSLGAFMLSLLVFVLISARCVRFNLSRHRSGTA